MNINIVKSLFYALLLGVGLATYSPNTYASTAAYEDTHAYIDSFPIPKDVEHLLFYIQRDPNTNTICYALNVDKGGRLDLGSPIHAFWIRYPEGGIRKELNFIQRKFAYGINTKKLNDGSYDVRSVAYSKLPLKLKKDAKGSYRVYANIDGKESVLERIFIRIGDGGTFWKPDVKYIELKGIEVKTGKRILERFKP
ncbi:MULTISPECIES: DUF4833 domain-containing protein [Olivibacter]|jgi:hypothetical protein|uniref:DUF4833 domain-containing protein n=2 Tax=Olivibacter TaxID=376469 RepID=A0ABV6HIY7_9SPHI|nr:MULTISPECIES: DUF4833 domain-containing protein [Olivibacter]MCL4638884.1 DUF4833 domain-containing protein [Olivibacter sp. UJ_SKK_5.1]MDM8174895.1 DUF4833 domain-containing protein [Olivibacter sp. 47]MDX3913426.1 DUF4833 domain-containing protein [Pseudosphingobacterium sp.]QEL01679.1 DUF4833 domain-containing protein [Olivibacter sp. LS-1]